MNLFRTLRVAIRIRTFSFIRLLSSIRSLAQHRTTLVVYRIRSDCPSDPPSDGPYKQLVCVCAFTTGLHVPMARRTGPCLCSTTAGVATRPKFAPRECTATRLPACVRTAPSNPAPTPPGVSHTRPRPNVHAGRIQDWCATPPAGCFATERMVCARQAHGALTSMV